MDITPYVDSLRRDLVAASESVAEPVAESATQPEAASAPPSGADLSQAALFRDPDDATEPAVPTPVETSVETPAQDPETVLDADDADDDPGVDDAAEASDVPATTEDEPAPSSDGPAHTPRTDADIRGSGSLFDL